MDMRVTPQVIASETIANAQQEYAQLAITQEQAATGNRILLPSDDPFGMLEVLSYRDQNNQITTDLNNVSDATSKLNLSVSTLNQTADLLAQAQDLAIQGSNGDNDSVSLNALAQQVNDILKQVTTLANTQQGGQYLFGGTATGKPPFVSSTVNGSQQVVYQGASQRASSPIGPGQTVDTFYTGQEVFQPQQRQATVITGTTGAAPGSGTDSATGEGTLLVQHTSTSYGGSSGVQAGSSSVSGDTILGPSGGNTLTIVDSSGTGASGTISLNNGPAIAFTNSDTNLQVTDSGGRVVYVNTSAITPGFNGTVAITSNGTLSTDGGKSTVPISFSSNQVVTNSNDGTVTNINSTNIRQTGQDDVQYPGTSDVFQALQSLSNDLSNTRGLSANQQAQVISQSISDLERLRTNVLNVVGEQGASLQNLQSYQSNMQNVQLQAKTQESNVDGADMSQIIVQLQAQQNALQLTLASATRVISQSLLDFLH